jgi:HEAT repeat protein
MWWIVRPRAADPNQRPFVVMSNNPQSDEPVEVTIRTPPVSRPATLSERLAVETAARSSRQPKQPTRIMQSAVAVVAADPSAASREAESLLRTFGRDVALARLKECVHRQKPPDRIAAARLLAQIADRSSLPLLLQLAADPALHDAAMPGIIRLSKSTELIRLHATETEPSIRRAILLATLRCGDRDGTEFYLSRLRDPKSRDAALAALHSAPAATVQPLLAALESPRVDDRFAAARALAELCEHGGAGEELRRMVQRNTHRREALAALMFCRDPAAVEFLKSARSSPAIDAEVRALQSQLSNNF